MKNTKINTKKEITLEDLAGMVKNKIENIILKQHDQRIEFLEEKMHRLEEFLIIK